MNCAKCQRASTAWLCWDCTKHLKRTLKRVPWLDENLDITVTRQDRLAKSGPRVGGETETPVLFNVGASQFRNVLRDTLTRWVRDMCEQRGVEYLPVGCTHPAGFIGPLPWGARRDHGDTPTTSDLARWLAHNTVAIMHSEDAGLCYDEITKLVEKGIEWINRPEPPVYRGPCPTVVGEDHRGRPTRCGVDLYAERDDDFARCPRCKVDHDVQKVEQDLLNAMDARLMSGAEIRRVMRELGEPVPESTFFHWRKTGRIRPRGWMHAGRITDHWIHRDDPPVFQLGDVRAARRGDSGKVDA